MIKDFSQKQPTLPNPLILTSENLHVVSSSLHGPQGEGQLHNKWRNKLINKDWHTCIALIAFFKSSSNSLTGDITQKQEQSHGPSLFDCVVLQIRILFSLIRVLTDLTLLTLVDPAQGDTGTCLSNKDISLKNLVKNARPCDTWEERKMSPKKIKDFSVLRERVQKSSAEHFDYKKIKSFLLSLNKLTAGS